MMMIAMKIIIKTVVLIIMETPTLQAFYSVSEKLFAFMIVISLFALWYEFSDQLPKFISVAQ